VQTELRQADLDISEAPHAAAAQTFIFDHLPKTGGSAMRVVFEQIFGVTNVSPAVSGRSEHWAKERFSSYRMIVGHFHSPVPVEFVKDGRARMTVLRDPIDRAVSEYFYYRNNVERVPWNKLSILAKDHDLFTYIKLLAGSRDVIVSNFYSRHFARQISRSLHSDTKILSLAKEALDRYDFVGIQEQMVDTVDLFCCRFGLPPVFDLPRINETSSRVTIGDLDRKTRDKLVAMNCLDVELYRFALSRFQEQKRKVFHKFAGRGELQDSLATIDEWAKQRASGGAHSSRTTESFGNLSIEISDAKIVGGKSGTSILEPGEQVTVCLTLDSHIDAQQITVGIEISDELGEIAFGTNTFLLGRQADVSASERYEVNFTFPANLRHGRYTLGAAVHTGESHEECCFHWCDNLTMFDIVDSGRATSVGYCRLETGVDWAPIPEWRAKTQKKS